jgi:hypothetical protein
MFHTYMSHEYVRNILAVSVLGCNKCFHVASFKCFIWMLDVFHTHVSSVCYKYFIYFRRMLHPSVSYFRGIAMGHGLGVWEWGVAVKARGTPRVMRTGGRPFGRPHPGSSAPPVRRAEGVRERSARGRQQAWGGDAVSELEEREERVRRKERRARCFHGRA